MNIFDILFRVCGVALICAFCALVLGDSQVRTLRIGGSVLIFGLLLGLCIYGVQGLEELLRTSGQGEGGYASRAFSIMLKALGVALLSRFCSDICRDCGQVGAADGVESVGRVVIFLLSLPLFSDIIAYAEQVLEMGAWS